jgi:catechol 2,3-dioxygenase-like lactoylglutathione lyase family enzyme
MIAAIDHVVILAPKLEAATRYYQALGFDVRQGGRHSTGTENALIGLANGAYVELLAFATPDPAHRWAPKLEFGGGFLDVCLVSDDIGGDVARYLDGGIEMAPIRAMGRQRPDGKELSWRLTIPKAPWAGQMPFLIEDVSPNEWRVPPAGEHSNGVVGIAALRWVVADHTALSELLSRTLGKIAEPINNDDYNAAGSRIELGATRIEILSPSGDGPAANWLAVQKGGPHSMAFLTSSGREIEHGPASAGSWANWPR